MVDILGRKLKIGDLIITDNSQKNSCVICKESICIVTGEERAFHGGADFKHGPAYLIENPSAKDLQLKAELEAKYLDYLQRKMKSEEAKREKAKQKNAEFKSMQKPVVGDILKDGDNYVLYLGICSLDFNGETREGHTYLSIPRIRISRYNSSYYEEINRISDKWLNYVTSNNNVNYKFILNYGLDRYDRSRLEKSGADIFVSNYKDITISKNYSRKYTEILHHVDLVDWSYGNAFTIICKYQETKYLNKDVIVSLTNKNK